MASSRLRWLVLGLLLSSPLLLAAGTKVRLGGVSVGFGFARYGGYGFYPYCGYYPGAWCDPFLYPYAGPFYPGFYSYAVHPGMGQVKLQTPYKTAEVYLNGAYAGTVKELKTIWLDPGVYELEIRPAKVEPFQKRIYVLSGKTIKLKFDEVRR